MAGSDEATGEAGETVAGVENEKDNSDQVESVEEEQQQVLAMVGLQLIKEPLKLLPVGGVRRGGPVEREKYAEHYEDAEHEDRDEGELDRVADLLAQARLHVVLVQPGVQAVVEIV